MSDENKIWYKKIYSKVSDTPEVQQSHQSFLLYRDALASITILFIGGLGWWIAQCVFDIFPLSSFVLIALLGEALLLAVAAQNSGNRMVVNAAAVALAKDLIDPKFSKIIT